MSDWSRWPVLSVAIAAIAAIVAIVGSAAADGTPDDNACVQCHRDLPGRSSVIVELEWKQSAHYAAGIGCDACHGGNASVRRQQFDSDEAWKQAAHLERDPAFSFVRQSGGDFVTAARGRQVSYFCGKCHADIKEKHLGSPHGEFGDPTCLYCHGEGSHAITHPTVDLIDTPSRAERGRCSPCHLASTMVTVSRIKTTLVETEQRIQEASACYEELEDWGYHNLELERLHDDADQVRSRLRQVFHSFNMHEINNFIGELRLTMDRTVATHEMISRLRTAQRRQATVGSLVAVMLLSFAGLLVYYRHAFLIRGREEALAEEP